MRVETRNLNENNTKKKEENDWENRDKKRYSLV